MPDPLKLARDLVPLVEQEASTSEQIATMPENVVRAFRDAGLFALQVPRPLGRNDAAMRAARALVFDLASLLPLRQATTWATDVAAEAVRFAYLASGSDGLRNPNVIGRYFRDIHAATQHVVVDDSTLTQAGRAFLGR